MATNDYVATNAQGVTYALVYTPPAGAAAAVYTLTITEPDGTQRTVSNINPNDVLTGNGTLTEASIPGNSVYVIPPGVTGTVNLLANLLGTSTIYVGGTVTLTGSAGEGTNTAIILDGGAANLGKFAQPEMLSGATITMQNGASFSASIISNFYPVANALTRSPTAGVALVIAAPNITEASPSS